MSPDERKKRRAEALNSSFMRIPHMKVEVARDFLDLGFDQVFELAGRAAETLKADLERQRREPVPADRLPYYRLAVYFAENDQPERQLLHPSAWE